MADFILLIWNPFMRKQLYALFIGLSVLSLEASELPHLLEQERNSSQRLEAALAEIAKAGDEGRRIFTRVYIEEARAAARAADERAIAGRKLGSLDGRIVSVKDLFDVRGEITASGSIARRDVLPATEDAVVIQRLRQAGAVIIGRTNMSEFAFSGIGVNPHYGTPGNAHDVTRIPGGSSSGAGVSVARGMAEIAIGSDTGGSIRIPAALNGVVGFKPSVGRVSTAGAYPLSYTLDTVGPLTKTVSDAAAVDAILSGDVARQLTPPHVRDLKLGVPRGLLLTAADDDVLSVFTHATDSLRKAGAKITDASLDKWMKAPFTLQQNGTLIAAEAAYIHKKNLEHNSKLYDPLILSRIQRGESMDAPSYVAIQQERVKLMHSLDTALEKYDALILPTVPFLPPLISDVENASEFMRINGLILRNTSVFNFYDLPAISIPIPRANKLPVGLMVVGRRGADHELLNIAAALEASMR